MMGWLESQLGYGGAPAPDPFAYLMQQQQQPPQPAAQPALALQQPQQQLDVANRALQTSRAEDAHTDFLGGLFSAKKEEAPQPEEPGAVPGMPRKKDDEWSLGKGVGGAASGAAIGTSISPGIGTAIGAGVGFLGSLF